MSTPTAPVPVLSRRLRPSQVAVRVLGVAVIAKAPGLLSLVVVLLAQLWITVPALLLAAAWHWRPARTKRALLAGVLLAHQQVQRRRDTAAKAAEAPVTT